jgi:hypothetical protein
MADLFENLLVMVLSIIVLAGGFYLLLLLLDWWLKFKAGSREQEGLTNLWLSTKQDPPSHSPGDEDEAIAGGSTDPDWKDPEI